MEVAAALAVAGGLVVACGSSGTSTPAAAATALSMSGAVTGDATAATATCTPDTTAQVLSVVVAGTVAGAGYQLRLRISDISGLATIAPQNNVDFAATLTRTGSDASWTYTG